MYGTDQRNKPGNISLVPFFFLRHGETDWNRQGLLQGSRDIPLNDTGLAQAQSAASALRNVEIATIVASPLLRARRTAEIVAASRGLEIVYELGLAETHWGAREGTAEDGLLPKWYAGETPVGAEPFAEFCVRIANAVARALAYPAPLLIVAHGGSFAALRETLGLPHAATLANAVPVQLLPEPWRVAGLSN
ncbi:MAG: histidine phosphatase family protein [Magnetospirillum sp.]|nr:histidine phosphatase family protein [Magnetospirillum sp.]